MHEVYRRWRKILDEYDGDRMAVAEAHAGSPEAMARYIREDELHQTFNFTWLQAPWSAAAFRRVVVDTFDSVEPVGGTPTWVLSNHDVVREPTRYGGGAVGVARSKAAVLTMMALPGSAYLYQGEELGLEEVGRAAGAPTGPGLVPRRRARRARRLPGADPLGGQHAAVRLQRLAMNSRGCRCRRAGSG